MCQAWIHAPLPLTRTRSRSGDGQSSAASTRRGRQTALRRAAKLWLELGLLVDSPVPDDLIRRERVGTPHPLTPPEVVQLRLSGRVGPRDTLRPAMVEAALAGASQQEIASLVVTSFDSDRGTLRLPGTRRTRGREVLLGPHGVAALGARIADLKRSALRRHLIFDLAETPLLHCQSHDASKNAPQLVARNLQRALVAARVNRPDVTAGSLQVFAANACYALTNRVERRCRPAGLAFAGPCHGKDRSPVAGDMGRPRAGAGRSLTRMRRRSLQSASASDDAARARTRDLRRRGLSVSSVRPSESETSVLKPRSPCC